MSINLHSQVNAQFRKNVQAKNQTQPSFKATVFSSPEAREAMVKALSGDENSFVRNHVLPALRNLVDTYRHRAEKIIVKAFGEREGSCGILYEKTSKPGEELIHKYSVHMPAAPKVSSPDEIRKYLAEWLNL